MGRFSDIFGQLLPTGRAYKYGKIGKTLIDANADGLERLTVEVDDFLNGVLPDNPDFDEDWCRKFEAVYGLSVTNSMTISQRKAQIRRAMTPPNPNRSLIDIQSIQDEIDNAGWAGQLYVFENPNGLFPYQVLPMLGSPPQLGDFQLSDFQLGTYNYAAAYPYLYTWLQLGDNQLGNPQLNDFPLFNNKIANSLNRMDDIYANLTPLAHTFYVCGVNFGDVVTLPASDEIPLRQLLLNIKPAGSVGFLLIKYI